MNALDELKEIGLRNELAKTRTSLSAQTWLIVIGALIISFFVGYVYRDQMKETFLEKIKESSI